MSYPRLHELYRTFLEHDSPVITLLEVPRGVGLTPVSIKLKVQDDGAGLAAAIRFFWPALDILTVPAWDCLPYDRASPNAEIVSRRVDTLTRLASPGAAHGGSFRIS